LAVNDFENNFFKLLNNAVYGKTMDNVDKRKSIILVSRWESDGNKLGARALISKLNFKNILQLADDFFTIQMKKVHVLYDKPVYIGSTVLELSKFKIYNFHYDYMKPKYQENINLLYMETDSFIYDIKTIDLYDDIRFEIVHFDTSEYDKDNVFKLPLIGI